jgi:uncharacterized membrane protein
MSKGRLEAFSDGVIAIIITIMVLELKVPHEAELSALLPGLPIFLSYVLSFANVGIYWNNHHHLFQAVKKVDGRVLWANMHLLFWLSLFPFATSWVGESNFGTWPVALYGVVLLLAGVAYSILTKTLIARNGIDSALAVAVGQATKEKLSVALYVAATLLAFVIPWLSVVIFMAVAIMWFIPDMRIEKKISSSE